MIVKQLYTKCLSQGAYYVESNGEAAVIDPLREVSEYINLAKLKTMISKIHQQTMTIVFYRYLLAYKLSWELHCFC